MKAEASPSEEAENSNCHTPSAIHNVKIEAKMIFLGVTGNITTWEESNMRNDVSS